MRYLFLILLIFIAGCVQAPSKEIPPGSNVFDVTINALSFEPPVVTINVGDTVRWTNKAKRPVWIASDPIITHHYYPDTHVRKCTRSVPGDIFDTCKSIYQDETFFFTFHHNGTWGYHDHLRSALQGTVMVETEES